MKLFLFFLLLTIVAAQNSVRGLVDRQLVSVVLPFKIDFLPSLFISSHFALDASCSATVIIRNVRPIVIAAQEVASHRVRANGESVFLTLVLESRMDNQDAVQIQTAAGHPKDSRAQMVCAASLVNPVAVPLTWIAAAGTRTRATFVSLWAALALDHAVFLQHHEQLSTSKEENTKLGTASI